MLLRIWIRYFFHWIRIRILPVTIDLSLIKYKPELTNLSLQWYIRSTFMPTNLKYKYIFLHFDLRSDPDFFPRWDGSGSLEKNDGSSSLLPTLTLLFVHRTEPTLSSSLLRWVTKKAIAVIKSRARFSSRNRMTGTRNRRCRFHKPGV